MKAKFPHKLNKARIKKGSMGSNAKMGFNGAFVITIKKQQLTVVVSDQMEWDHVSVSTPHRCPSWNEMCAIKDLFFDPEEHVIQYHPPKSMYVNDHDFVLHMWRPHGQEVPTPPLMMV